MTDEGSVIQITNTSLNTDVTLASIGGVSLVDDGAGPSLSIHGLSGSAGISVTDEGSVIQITNTSLNTDVTLANAGGTETLVVDGSGPSLTSKGLSAGTGITLTGGANDVSIAVNSDSSVFEYNGTVVRSDAANSSYSVNADFVFGSQQLNDAGNANEDARIIFDKSAGAFYTGVANGTQWDTRGDQSFIGGGVNNAATGPQAVALGGNANTASGTESFAVGGGSSATNDNTFVWSDGTTGISSTNINEVSFGATGGFRVLGNGDGTPAYSAGQIYFDAVETVVTGKLTVDGLIDPTGLQCVEQSTNPGSVVAGNGTFWVKDDVPNVPAFTDDGGTDHTMAYLDSVTLSNLGGTSLVGTGTGPSLTIHGLSSGTGITVADVGNTLEITNSSPASSVTLTSAGGSTSLVQDGTGAALAIRGLNSGTGISLTQNANSVDITNSSPASSVTLASAGGSASLVQDGTGAALVIRGLNSGTGISLTQNTNNVNITNSSPASSVTLSSAGGDRSLVNDGTGPDLAVRGISEGRGIITVQNTSDVTLQNTWSQNYGYVGFGYSDRQNYNTALNTDVRIGSNFTRFTGRERGEVELAAGTDCELFLANVVQRRYRVSATITIETQAEEVHFWMSLGGTRIDALHTTLRDTGSSTNFKTGYLEGETTSSGTETLRCYFKRTTGSANLTLTVFHFSSTAHMIENA